MIELDINTEFVEDLLIYKNIEELGLNAFSFGELSALNIKNLSLKSDDWILDKGRKSYRKYYNHLGELCAEISFDYELDGNRVVDYSKKIDYFTMDGVGLSKSINVKVSVDSILKLNKAIWVNQIDYLRAKGEELRVLSEALPEPHKTQYLQVAGAVDSLWSHYKDEIIEYEQIGGDTFPNAVNNESDPSIIGTLSIPVNEKGETVKEVILNQIT